MKPPKAALALGAIALAGMALALALPQGGVAGLLDLTAERLQPPPEIRILTPADGDGVGATVSLAGQALSNAQPILDVQYRIDGGRWESAPLSVRGQRTTAFQAEIPLGPGDHVIEARAYDGETLSLPARIEVRRDAPTVRILSPADGDGLRAGETIVSGTVRGRADSVALEVDGVPAFVPVQGGAWSASIVLAPGTHTLRATALGVPHSLPHTVRVAVGDPAPPAVRILSPHEGAAYGAAGDLACGGGCIVVTGNAERARFVRIALDGLAGGESEVLLGTWTHRIPMAGLASGPHHLSVRAYDADETPSVARNLTFLARTPLALDIEGTASPEPTGTPLSFHARGENAGSATWTLDGRPLSAGDAVTLTLDTPGDHVLSVQASAPRGGSASASVMLHALNRAPSVAFHGEPELVEGQLRFAVQATDPDGSLTQYRWDFGDGRAITTREPTALHRFSERGSFLVAVTAVDDLGAETTVTTLAFVANLAPAADFTWSPETPSVMDVITLRDASVDHDGALVEREWRLPDGNRTDDPAPLLRLRERGAHDVTLRVVDDEGLVTHLTRSIHVVNLAPEPSFRYDPALPVTREEVLFADSSVDVDGPIVSWHWDFGDNATSDEPHALHRYLAPGTYTVRLTVVDDLGLAANLTRNVTVLDAAPAVRNVTIEPPEPHAQQEARFAVVADDREGDVVAARWEFGDGTTSDQDEPLHRYARSGAYFGNVTVFDQGGLNVTFPFTVHVRNAPPVASLETERGGRIAAFPTILVANATDPDGRVTFYRFDADGDGEMDCETTEPTCAYVYESAGHYAAHLWVEDDEGGIAQTQTLLDVTLPPADHPPPRVQVESPARGASLRGEHLVRGAAGGPRDIVRVDLQLRAGDWAYGGGREPWRLAGGTSEWRALLDTTRLPDGEYELVVRATDAAGGVGLGRVPVTIQNGPRASDVTLQLIEPPTHVESDLLVRASAFHPEGVTGIRWRIDTGDWITETENALAFHVEIDRDALKPGEHVLRIEAYHGVTESANVTHVFTVPGVAPVLVVDQAPNSVAHGMLRAEGRIVGEGRAQWRIDQGLWNDLPPGESWQLAEDTLGQRGGRHVLHLRAISPDGRLTSDVHSYKIDIVNPPFAQSTTDQPEPPVPRLEVPALPLATVLAALAVAAWRRRG